MQQFLKIDGKKKKKKTRKNIRGERSKNLNKRLYENEHKCPNAHFLHIAVYLPIQDSKQILFFGFRFFIFNNIL